MRPIDFVLFDGDSSPNLPVRVVAEALKTPIKIRSLNREHEILSYYYDDKDKCLVLEIQKIK